MKFECDEQTQNDLAIFRNGNSDKSLLNLFNRTITFGATDKLREIFETPLTDKEQITHRIDTIKYLQENPIELKIEKGPCDFIEFYLAQGNKPTLVSKIRAIEKWVQYYFRGNSDYYVIERGIKYTLQLFDILRNFTATSNIETLPILLQGYHRQITETLNGADFKFTASINPKKPGAIEIAQADHLFRYKGFARLKQLMDIVYMVDVYSSVAARGKILGFNLPVINQTDNRHLQMEGMFHPFITKPVANSVSFNSQHNICFVTGTNMAGKSTFLKSIGICIFLSQIGFPVPAVYMETSVFNGLITTINLPDNINQGNSHFYSEVLRVKHVAQKIAEQQNVFVIFDELFRGTNVKDAYDASLSIINSFAQIRTCFFVISTHIVEVANELADTPNINFKFMETIFDKGSPTFSYLLKDGITDERLGMWIVKNEGIIDIIEGIINKTKVKPPDENL